jgi:hypothetical protein
MTMDKDPGTSRAVSELAPRWPKHRQFVRFRVDLRVELYRIGEREPHRGYAGELGEGGLGAIMVADLPAGEVVTLEFGGSPLPRPVRVHAVVRTRVGYRYGFEFLSLSSEDRALIHAAALLLPLAA